MEPASPVESTAGKPSAMDPTSSEATAPAVEPAALHYGFRKDEPGRCVLILSRGAFAGARQ